MSAGYEILQVGGTWAWRYLATGVTKTGYATPEDAEDGARLEERRANTDWAPLERAPGAAP